MRRRALGRTPNHAGLPGRPARWCSGSIRRLTAPKNTGGERPHPCLSCAPPLCLILVRGQLRACDSRPGTDGQAAHPTRSRTHRRDRLGAGPRVPIGSAMREPDPRPDRIRGPAAGIPAQLLCAPDYAPNTLPTEDRGAHTVGRPVDPTTTGWVVWGCVRWSVLPCLVSRMNPRAGPRGVAIGPAAVAAGSIGFRTAIPRLGPTLITPDRRRPTNTVRLPT